MVGRIHQESMGTATTTNMGRGEEKLEGAPSTAFKWGDRGTV